MNQRKPPETDIALERGLPSNPDAEKFILGSIMLDGERFADVAAALNQESWSTEAHRRIFARMTELHERGEKIDRVTVANELLRYNELESVDGLSYLVSLDDGLPHISNLDSYVRIVRDKATLRRIAMASQHLMNRALMGEEDPDDILAAAQESMLKIGERSGTRDLMDPLEIIQAYEGGLNSFLDPSKRPRGVSSGFTRFDEMTQGLRGGQLAIIGARPGQGKSSFGMNVAWHVAAHLREPVAVFSLEMTREELLTRLICSAGRIDSQRFRAGYLNDIERHKLRATAQVATEAPIYIDDSPCTTLLDIKAKLLRLLRKLGKLGLIVVDYLQLIGTKGRVENRANEVGAISRGLKLLSKEIDTPILALSQLSRAVESRTDKRPMMSDLRESGGIENDADLIGFLFRESQYKPDREDLRGIAELIVAKQRSGPVGVITLVWLAAQTRFENMADDLPPEGERLPYAD